IVNDGACAGNPRTLNVHVGKAPPTLAVLSMLPGPSIITLSPTPGGAPVDQLSALVQMGFGPAPVHVSSAAHDGDAAAAEKTMTSAIEAARALTFRTHDPPPSRK